ncbi:S-methylmethionine--homocysteine S-methyltransferase BHMT2-like [Ptychodera flava]|uniref:S-methylmethionine--homocysteine S-methyltransferase BHMT2-like n=1 Tax=Ptychodera flava TaxID=63121 RepID=UPI003969FFF8
MLLLIMMMTVIIIIRVPAVMMLASYPITTKNGQAITSDGVPLTEACKKLKDAGADVVGLNCARGSATMMPIMHEIRKVCKVRRQDFYRSSLGYPCCSVALSSGRPCTRRPEESPAEHEQLFPTNLEVASCSHGDIVEFGKECKELGIQYVGICCGNRPCLTRTLAESLGRKPPASEFSKDISKHVTLGSDPRLKQNVLANNLKFFCNKIDIN